MIWKDLLVLVAGWSEEGVRDWIVDICVHKRRLGGASGVYQNTYEEMHTP
jgi:hypothetical protein